MNDFTSPVATPDQMYRRGFRAGQQAAFREAADIANSEHRRWYDECLADLERRRDRGLPATGTTDYFAGATRASMNIHSALARRLLGLD